MLVIAGVKVEHIAKSYTVAGTKLEVFCDLNFMVDANAITVIIGKSGCGKTTFLKIVSGMEKADSGQIIMAENEKIGMVFQEPRLMPWLTCWQNITFGVSHKTLDKNYIAELIKTVGLTGFEKAYPNQLSGGMQQRTALARALAYNPSLILMDEPFAALDFFTRGIMQQELVDLQTRNRKSVVFVTHSIDEALLLGQKIVIFENGRVKDKYDLSNFSYPRDVLSEPLIKIKRDILHIMKS